jgi:hypothetical protein
VSTGERPPVDRDFLARGLDVPTAVLDGPTLREIRGEHGPEVVVEQRVAQHLDHRRILTDLEGLRAAVEDREARRIRDDGLQPVRTTVLFGRRYWWAKRPGGQLTLVRGSADPELSAVLTA